MAVNFKNKKELTFLAIGILMLIIAIFYIVVAIRFLFSNLKQVTDTQAVTNVEPLKFQVEKFEALRKK